MPIVPASKVSVPLTVVMRTRSRVPERVTLPPPIKPAGASEKPPLFEDTHMPPLTFVKIMWPYRIFAAEMPANGKPVVEFTAPVVLVAAEKEAPARYPVVKIEPAPICTWGLLVPFVLKPLNIMVIRLTQLGMPVKSMLVPDVEGVTFPLAMLVDKP